MQHHNNDDHLFSDPPAAETICITDRYESGNGINFSIFNEQLFSVEPRRINHASFPSSLMVLSTTNVPGSQLISQNTR